MARNPSRPKMKRGCLTSFLVLILIIVVAVGGAILYFRMNIPEEVEYTEKRCGCSLHQCRIHRWYAEFCRQCLSDRYELPVHRN